MVAQKRWSLADAARGFREPHGRIDQGRRFGQPRILGQLEQLARGGVGVVPAIAGLKGDDKPGGYALSKAAAMQLARNLAVEWGRSNVRVNTIAPGLVRTDMARALWDDPDRLAHALESYPLGRLGEHQDLAGAAVFLASRAGNLMTGQTLVIDGGTTVMGWRYS